MSLCEIMLVFFSMFDLFLCGLFEIGTLKLQNIPQFAIQIAYLFNENKDPSIIVYFSLMFTISSMLFAFQAQCLRLVNYFHEKEINYGFKQEIRLSGKMTLESSDLRYHHSFKNSNISKCIQDVLNTCEDKDLWLNRDDAFYNIELYYIDQRILTLNEMDCYFEISILMSTFQNPNTCSNIAQKMKHNVDQMAVEGTQNKNKFVKV